MGAHRTARADIPDRRKLKDSWQQDPWARGAYGIVAAGQLCAWKEHHLRPEGRLYFAGAHTSLEYAAWIEGAVRSGHRAATEVNDQA
jgi:monoamine oxidase